MQAIILAGGAGSRLRPFTTVIPKPLMPLGNRAIIGIILQQLQRASVTDIVISLGHLGELIEAYVSRMVLPGTTLSYVREKTPLGTAGPLSLVENLDDHFLVMNGDVLTDIDFQGIYRSHIDNNDDITVAAFARSITIDLGVLAIDKDARISDYIEKPSYSYLASTGIYVIRKTAVADLPRGVRIDLPQLVLRSLKARKAVRAYRFEGFWMDIGRPDDYQYAQDNLISVLSRLGLQESP